MLKRGSKYLLVIMLVTTLLISPQVSATENPHSLQRAFEEAAAEFDVPVQLLMAVSYAETRWNDHQGQPSHLNGYGVMHLVDHPNHHTLDQASRLLDESPERLKTETPLNIRGGAAVLARIAKKQNNHHLPEKLGQWYTAVAEYAGYQDEAVTRLYVDEVFKVIQKGAKKKVKGETLLLSPTQVKPNKGKYEKATTPIGKKATPDYPNAHWVAAHGNNYTAANRERDGNQIQYVVIHTTQGSYAGSISWFQNPSASVSAHYVIRSSDGDVTQMVQNQDIAWHAGNWDYNVHSIGIEHEGYVEEAGWYTDSLYRSSAALTRWLCDTYDIPRDRKHIIGHNQVPGATHTDPGPLWDWDWYMSLVNQ
ncbi:hypothetical protein JOD24_001098 [Kroppenstedtia sanguinis]|uniref:N-acetylmuramoyl-L-alanine amidase n=1 Tax=Kroppenstedtia sanguinis TaxID=1380684 RepID=A0ABW4C9R7_9BACL